jgi:hypothetical protein
MAVSGMLAGIAFAELPSARAADPSTTAAPWRETSAGVTASPKSWAAYSSATIAPFGSLDTDGARIRLGSGYGQYRYDTLPAANGDCRYGYGDGRTATITGRVTFADILAGYQLSYGGATIKAFAGLAMDQQDLAPIDICNRASGRQGGFKGVIESWTNLTPSIWVAADASWAQAHETYALRLRLGYRLHADLSIGLEEAAVGNVAGDETRSGLFARYDWAGGEVSLAGGVSGEHFDYREMSKDQAWAAANVMLRF